MTGQKRFEGTSSYIASAELIEIVNVAIALERPLLIRGEPGTGKTLLAGSVADAIGMELLTWHVKSTSKARDGLYVYDTVQRLNDSRFGDGDVKNINHYIKAGPLGQNITEFNYRFHKKSEAWIFVGITTEKDHDEKDFAETLRDGGYHVLDLTDNELTKNHIRHMIGGRGRQDKEREVLYSFRFPERPGALADFLDTLGKRWNISLFHYRFYGADYGRVLIGLEVPVKDQKTFGVVLKGLDIDYCEETQNPAYEVFL